MGCAGRHVRGICAQFPHLARDKAALSGLWGRGDPEQRRENLPLHLVGSRSGLDDVRALVEAYPQALRERDQNGNLPLHCAFDQSASPDVIRHLLLEYPESIREPSARGVLPVRAALRRYGVRGGIPLVKLVVEMWPEGLGEKDESGRTPLHEATNKLPPPLVLTYLAGQCPAALREKDREGRLPLHFNGSLASAFSVREEELLMAAQALVQAWPGGLRERSHRGDLPLHAAAQFQCVGLARLYVEHFPRSVRERASDGAIPLHRASVARGPDVARYLVHAWPESVRETDFAGLTPLHTASRYVQGTDPFGDSKVSIVESRIETVRFLLQAWTGAARVRANDGSLPLHCAAPAAKLETVQLLVDAYPESVHAVTNDGRSPLHCACDESTLRSWEEDDEWHAERKAVLGFLLERWEDSIRLPCRQGFLPVHYAAQRMVTSATVRFLVEKCPESVGMSTGDGSLPIHLAVASPLAVAAGTFPTLHMVRFLVGQMPRSLLIPDSNGSLPLHSSLTSKEPSPEIVQFLVEHSPGALHVTNSAGSLPVHVAASQAKCPLKAFTMLVESYPEALQAKDGHGMLPFQIAAGNDLALDVVFYLVKKWPAGASTRGGEAPPDVDVEDSFGKKRKREVKSFETELIRNQTERQIGRFLALRQPHLLLATCLPITDVFSMYTGTRI
jgi:ankyrin repeat protein